MVLHRLVAKNDMTVHVLAESLRKKISNQSKVLNNDPTLSIFLFCKNKLLSGSDSTIHSYIELKDL